MRDFTGFDRVMIYRFAEDDSGKVIAEAARENLETFLGMHYPASDIPKQARALYVKQTLRFLVDVNAVSSAVVPTFNPNTKRPLDMSYATLQAMSPIHSEVDLHEVLQDSLLFLQARIQENNVEIKVPRQMPKAVGDAVRVSEIFSNLISNAIKYNDKEMKKIEIGYLENAVRTIADEAKTEQLFYVRDNGIGIEERHQADVFRIFKRLH